jgi:hypothetical protein
MFSLKETGKIVITKEKIRKLKKYCDENDIFFEVPNLTKAQCLIMFGGGVAIDLVIPDVICDD